MRIRMMCVETHAVDGDASARFVPVESGLRYPPHYIIINNMGMAYQKNHVYLLDLDKPWRNDHLAPVESVFV